MEREIEVRPHVGLVPVDADKHTRSRMGRFAGWLTAQGRKWHEPDLAVYRDSMLAKGYRPSTIAAHLSTVRAQYRRLIKDNGTRDLLYGLAAETTDSKAEQKALVDEVITRLQNAVDPDRSRVKAATSQDRPDSADLRLTKEQADALLAAPGVDTLAGLRDTAITALLLCTGIREAELSGLDVPDLRRYLGGELALHVREGKGRKERLIPYGELDWVLVIVEAWLRSAGIEEGPVFRGLHKGGHKLRPGRLSLRAIEYIVAGYPIAVDGKLVTARPHDLRRTYARRLYEAGVDLVAIQQNLGHSSVQTTLGYIGELDAAKRRAPMVYTFDFHVLFKQAEMSLTIKLPKSTD